MKTNCDLRCPIVWRPSSSGMKRLGKLPFQWFVCWSSIRTSTFPCVEVSISHFQVHWKHDSGIPVVFKTQRKGQRPLRIPSSLPAFNPLDFLVYRVAQIEEFLLLISTYCFLSWRLLFLTKLSLSLDNWPYHCSSSHGSYSQGEDCEEEDDFVPSFPGW